MYIIYNSAPAADTQGFWWGDPLSHGLRRASSPKGTPLSYTGNFAATTEAVPLGKVAKPQALTEGVVSETASFHFSLKLYRHAKGPISEGAVTA